ncbi:MAG: hydroxymethylbilane synthase [Erysipelotrichaceae bacterium]|nr:hydroxymethylbilane synthase [Erysipelotrichaceae bacterium]
MHYKIGTRGSKLALAQTELVIRVLEEHFPEHSFEAVIITTKGDKDQQSSLKEIGGQGIFIKEIEAQLLEGKIDLAVHSMKDIPSELPEELILSSFFIREDNRDALILNHAKSLAELPQGATIATSSIRREKQLLKLRPDLNIVPIRGNVDTRIQKMKDHNYDGLVLAAAGLKRLGKEDLITQYLSINEMIPSPNQGTIAIEMLKNHPFLETINSLKDIPLYKTVRTERLFLQEMNAGCKEVIGANAEYIEKKIHLDVIYKDAIAHVVGKMPDDTVHEAIRQINRQIYGKVTIVGGGTGDPDLLTLKAVKALQQADCVLYDALLGQEVLKFVPSNTELIFVGKREEFHTVTQDEINELLYQKAKQYQNVVRLKTGDAFIFGRGAEELRYLNDKGIRNSAVSGISSIQSATCAYGIPLTDRYLSTGFVCLSGHKPEKLDYAYLAESTETIVILMGFHKLDSICHGLVNAGKHKKTPIAVICNATQPNQKISVGTLEDIRYKVIEDGITSPAVIVIGSVVYEYKPAETTEKVVKHIYLPKINPETSSLAIKLRALGHSVHEIQVGQIDYLPVTCDFDCDYVLFTSKHAVDGFFKTLNVDIRTLAKLKFLVKGTKTQEKLKSYGITAEILDNVTLTSIDKVAYFKDNKEHDLEVQLAKQCQLSVYPVYQNTEIENTPITILKDGYVVFTASSNVDRFMRLLKNDEPFTAFSIGKSTTATCKSYNIDPIEAKETTYESIIEAINHEINR